MYGSSYTSFTNVILNTLKTWVSKERSLPRKRQLQTH